MIRSATIKNKVYKFVHKKDVSVSTNLYGRAFDNACLNIDPYGKITVKGSNGNGYDWDIDGISRKEADVIFWLILKEAGFRLWRIYGAAVLLGGSIYGHWKTKTSMPNIRVTGCSWMPRSMEQK